MAIRLHAISRLEGGKLDGIHLLWSPPHPAGHSLDGFTILRRRAVGEKPHCFEISIADLARVRSQGVLALADAVVWATIDETSGVDGQRTYQVQLRRRHSAVTVAAPGALAVFVGTDAGAVVAGRSGSASSLTFQGSDIATVWIVTRTDRTPIGICGDVQDEPAWSNAKPIVEGLQVPFSAANSAVMTVQDGFALAKSRAQPEEVDEDGFEELSRYANAALARPGGVPAGSVVSEESGGAGSHDWDVSPFGLALAAMLLPPWRRAWGFGHLDRDGLVPGERYDYRIIGTVRRRDRDERLYDFHTVPRGTRLPRCFRLGSALVWSKTPPIVRVIETAPGDPAVIRKGFRTDQLTMVLDVPARRIAMEATPGAPIEAIGFRDGVEVGALNAVTGRRTVLDFGADVDRVLIRGRLEVAGVVPAPLDPALDPEEPVKMVQTICDVEFAATAPPASPGGITATNLSDPARSSARGAHDANRGFAIEWDASPAVDPVALAFLPLTAAAAPTDAAYYLLEHSLSGAGFTPVHGAGVHASGRNVAISADPPGWGFDVLRAYPTADAAPHSHAERVHAIEVFEPGDLPFGAEVTYRVRSVDATGRVSTPTTSAPVPLRTHVRPPVPSTPPESGPLDPARPPVSGVQVRLLQHDDPALTPEERALAAADVVLVRWGWGPEQRAHDPDVVEFRVYHHTSSLTDIEFRPAGHVDPAGAGWSLPVHTSRPVTADEFAGVRIVLGAAYLITGHPAGSDLVLSLAPSPVDPGRAPQAQPFRLNRTTSAELDPEYWDTRAAVVPRVPAPPGSDEVEAYHLTLPATWIAVDAETPRQRAAYGVTASDAEPYVDDRRTGEPAPRAGNESTVAGVEVIARYFGRPVLAIADLVGVPAITLARQAGDQVHGVLRPLDFLPAGFSPGGLMLLERLPASAVLTRVRVEPAGIRLVAADGTGVDWPLSAADEAALRSGDSDGLIPDRFLAHAAARLDGLDSEAVRLGSVAPTLPFEDTLPNRPSRWIYRLRALDAASRPSAEAQVLGVVLHVPSPARAVVPTLQSLVVEAGTVTVRVQCARTEGEVFVFVSTDDSFTTSTASLATIRERHDLTAIDRLVVRDDAGRRIRPLVAAPDANGDAIVVAPLPPTGLMVHAWALALSPDGSPSRLIGPLHARAARDGS